VIRVWDSNQVTGQPPVKLRLAWPTTPKSRINVRSNSVVLATKGPVSLQVAVLEQHLQHDGFGVQ
jgi:hypothetical protein